MYITMLFEAPAITDEHRNALLKMTPFGKCVGVDITGKFGDDFDTADDLRAAVSAAESWIVDGGHLDHPDPDMAGSAEMIVDQLRAAIAKAEGRT